LSITWVCLELNTAAAAAFKDACQYFAAYATKTIDEWNEFVILKNEVYT
jgi:hypothetical protein